MITKLQNPTIAASIGVVVSLGVGVAASWRSLEVIAAHAVVVQPKQQEKAELKEKGWDFWTIEIENLSNELKEEKVRLKKQSELLDQRAARLAAEEKEFAKLRADVEGLRKQIAEKVIEISADETKNIRSLAQTYTNLTPRAAVAIFRELDDNTAVKILSLMKPDVVGPIFEEMSKTATPGAEGSLAKRAALLSEKLRLMKAAKASAS
jgi:flagellar motility protein MotE (MotC chaperone)